MSEDNGLTRGEDCMTQFSMFCDVVNQVINQKFFDLYKDSESMSPEYFS